MSELKLTKKDFASANTVKWCPGCGDFAILASLQSTLAKLGAKKEDTVFVSGIGCSGRLPYYMNTFGLHTLHGRAPAFATGLKLARPELSVWVIVGDGDGLSIGGNQLLHALRRNLNINVILINNQIYGLTKGQFSPTSEQGKVTKTSPQGSLEVPINPIQFALTAGASFVARAVDVDRKNLEDILMQAHAHPGASFVEVLQNCHIFNEDSFTEVRDKKLRDEKVLYLNHNEPLLFGKDFSQSICLEQLNLSVKKAGNPENTLIHDKTNSNLAYLLSQLTKPLPLGVFKDIQQGVYEQQFHDQANFDFDKLAVDFAKMSE